MADGPTNDSITDQPDGVFMFDEDYRREEAKHINTLLSPPPSMILSEFARHSRTTTSTDDLWSPLETCSSPGSTSSAMSISSPNENTSLIPFNEGDSTLLDDCAPCTSITQPEAPAVELSSVRRQRTLSSKRWYSNYRTCCVCYKAY